jgi:hypothetical protein
MIDYRVADRRKAARVPSVMFRAGIHGRLYNNVNFARSEAEGMANGLGSGVTLYQVVNGRAFMLSIILPDMA